MRDFYNDIGDENRAPGVFRRGADDGWRMGLLMSAIFLAAAYSAQVPLLGLLSLLLMIAVPVVAYLWLRRDWLKWPRMRFFSAAWMQGICLFFFGSLILALVMFVFMKYIQPDFIDDSVHMAIDAYRTLGSPEALQMADLLQQMTDKHLLPSAISLSVSMIWSVTFTGSILSMVLTFIIKLTTRNK